MLVTTFLQGTHWTGKTGKMAQKNPSGKTQGIWKFCQNTGNLICSIWKFPGSKRKRYFKICPENLHFLLLKLDKSAKSVSFVYVILTNQVQGEFAVGQGKDREFENTILVGTLFLNECRFI